MPRSSLRDRWEKWDNWTHRSAWTEWGPFWLAVILAAGLLLAFALTSPIFRGPAPLPESDPSRYNRTSASSDQSPPEGPQLAPSDQPEQAPSYTEPPPP